MGAEGLRIELRKSDNRDPKQLDEDIAEGRKRTKKEEAPEDFR